MNADQFGLRAGTEIQPAQGPGHSPLPREGAKAPDSCYALDVSVDAGRVLRHRVAFPWSLGRPYGAEDWNGAFRLIPQVSGAGLLSGDHIRQRVRLGKGGRLRLESAGAMQVLAGRRGPAQSDWRFDLEPGAMLVLDAEPFALMPGANLTLRTDISLAPGAIVLAAEMLCHIHAAPAGPRQAFGAWQTETRVTDAAGKVQLMDRQRADHLSGARLRQLPDRAAAFGTLWMLADKAIKDPIVAHLPRPDCRMGISPLRAGLGVAIRMAAEDGGTLRRACHSLMRILEPRLARAQAA